MDPFYLKLIELLISLLPPILAVIFLCGGIFIYLLYRAGFRITTEDKGIIQKHPKTFSLLFPLFLWLIVVFSWYGMFELGRKIYEIEITYMEKKELEEQLEKQGDQWVCKPGLFCTNFNDKNIEDDPSIEGIHDYERDETDPQLLTHKSTRFPAPMICLNKEVNPLFNAEFYIHPLNEEEANVFVGAKNLFRFFFGASDYHSIVFRKIDPTTKTYTDEKIFLKSLEKPPIKPKTIMKITINTEKGSEKQSVLVKVNLNYTSIYGDEENASLERTITVPSAQITSFPIKIGAGLGAQQQEKNKGKDSVGKFLWGALESRKITPAQ